MPSFKTPITLSGAPTTSLHAATKQYVDDNSGIVTMTTETNPRPQIVGQSLRIGSTEFPSYRIYEASAYLFLDRPEWEPTPANASDASIVFRTGGAATAEIGHAGDENHVNFKVVTGEVWQSETYIDSFKMMHPSGDVTFYKKVGIGLPPVELFHISQTNTTGRVLAKIENNNSSSGSRSVCFALASTGISWSFGTDAGLNGGNNFFIKDEASGERLFIDSSGRVGIKNTDAATTLDVSGSLRSRPVTLTDAANIATDAALSNHFRVTLGGNRTLDNPTNPQDGQKATWEIIQDGTGSRTLTLGSAFAFGTDITSYTATTTAGKRDFIGAIYNSTAAKWHIVAVAKGY